MKENSSKNLEKSYFDVLGLCCSSEVPLIEKILRPIDGVHDVFVIVPSRTVIVVHDTVLVSSHQIVNALNQASLEANVRVKGETNYRNKWPSPFAVACGVLLLLSFLSYFFSPFKWLALGAVAVGIIPILLKSFASLRHVTLDVNTLMLIAVGGSIYLKDYWEVGTIVFLFTIATWLESRAVHKATAVMSSLMNMAPQKAVLASNGEEVNVNEVMVNTMLAVKAGDVIPIDGIVVTGRCEVDEKSLTGESFPVSKEVDSIVWAGTINLNAVFIVATLLAVIPIAMKLHNVNKWLHLALVVLVSACPCALILSTPVATYCALSKAATTGLLVKGAEYIETLSTVKIFAFDKTGTITKGDFSVSDFRSVIDDISQHKLLYWVSSIESKSSHPMAATLMDYAQSNSVKAQPDNVEVFENFPGEGIYGKIEGKNVYIGNQKIASRAGCSTDLDLNREQESMEGKSIGYVFLGSSLVGVFGLSDTCRTGAKEALKELKLMGIKTAMLIGDSKAAANHAQNQLGGALEILHAELLPQDKAKIIKDFQKIARTAMVGDGINDAPALATADIGISMGISGSALATETGHIILMSNDIRKLPIAVKLARKTQRKIFENIFFSIITKVVVIVVALACYPLVWLAVLSDVGTCLVVIGNNMLLLQAKTVSNSGKRHSHSSHDHKHCHSKKSCGHDGKVHESKHAVQGTEDKHGCSGHDHDHDHVHNVSHSIRGKKETYGHNHGHHLHEVKKVVEETIYHHNCCIHDDGNVHVVKHIVQETRPKHSCCSHSTKEIHEVKEVVQQKESNHAFCAHGDEVQKVKHLEQVHKSHGCCAIDDSNVNDEVQKVKHIVQATENKHGCCGHAGNEAQNFMDSDVESQIRQSSYGNVVKKKGDCCHDQITHKKGQSNQEKHSNSSDHHHRHVKEYITKEELGGNGKPLLPEA